MVGREKNEATRCVNAPLGFLVLYIWYSIYRCCCTAGLITILTPQSRSSRHLRGGGVYTVDCSPTGAAVPCYLISTCHVECEMVPHEEASNGVRVRRTPGSGSGGECFLNTLQVRSLELSCIYTSLACRLASTC